MRRNALLAAILALVLAGSAGAASGKPKLVRVVKRRGLVTATLAYTRAGEDRDMTLSIRRGGKLLLTHRMCPIDFQREPCRWAPGSWWLMKRQAPLAFRDVAGARAPAVVSDIWTGGANCREDTFIAVAGSRPAWIAQDWGPAGYKGRRLGGRYYFVSGDGRFTGQFSSFAGTWWPSQVWTISRAGRLANVTRLTPSFVRADAQRAWRTYHDHPIDRGLGILTGWRADEYTLGLGARCSSLLHEELKKGRLGDNGQDGLSAHGFIRTPNRDLERWGYKRR